MSAERSVYYLVLLTIRRVFLTISSGMLYTTGSSVTNQYVRTWIFYALGRSMETCEGFILEKGWWRSYLNDTTASETQEPRSTKKSFKARKQWWMIASTMIIKRRVLFALSGRREENFSKIQQKINWDHYSRALIFATIKPSGRSKKGRKTWKRRDCTTSLAEQLF